MSSYDQKISYQHIFAIITTTFIIFLTNISATNIQKKWSSQDLMPEMVNDVVGNDPSKLAELVKYPIPCDTQFECKRRTQFGKRKMKCQICPNQMYITSSKYYEADKDTEKSPYAEKDKMPGEESDESGGASGGNGNDKDTNNSTGPASASGESSSSASSSSFASSSGVANTQKKKNCQKKEDDQFILPCCVPETNDDNSLKIVPPNTAPTGTLQCCGGGPACCRWCSEYVCDNLETSNEMLPQLWWHVCNDKDIDETTSKRFHQEIADQAKPNNQKLLRNGVRL
jgi:hypothetical protein